MRAMFSLRRRYNCLRLRARSKIRTKARRSRTSRSWNRLAPNRLASNRLAANRLASNRLARIADARRASSRWRRPRRSSRPRGPRGLQLLRQLRARRATSTIEAEVPTAQPIRRRGLARTPAPTHHCMFPGALGLAPEWRDHSSTRRARVGSARACSRASTRSRTPRRSRCAAAHPRSDRSASTRRRCSRVRRARSTATCSSMTGRTQIDWNACRGEGAGRG